MRVIDLTTETDMVINPNLEQPMNRTFVEVEERDNGDAILDMLYGRGLKNVVLVERDGYHHGLDLKDRVRLEVGDVRSILFYFKAKPGEAFRLMQEESLFVSGFDTSNLISHEIGNNGEFVPVDF